MFWKKGKKKQQKKEASGRIYKDLDMIKALAPNGLIINSDHLILENYYMRFYTIVNYPEEAYLKWLSTLNIAGVSWSYHVGEINLVELIKRTNDAITSKEHQLERTKDAIVKNRILDDIKNSTIMLKKMDSDIEKTVGFSILIRIVGYSLDELEDRAVKLKTRCASNKIPVKPVTFAQEQCLLKNMPLNLDIPIRYVNAMPVSNITIGFPFLNNYINDDQGIILGYDENFNDIILNFWNKNKVRFNSNATIIGDSGSGKTMLTKDILYQEYITGTKHLVIDIEREYTKLAKRFEGDVINLAGGTFAINPYEIFLQYAISGEEEETETQVPALSTHIKHLEKWLCCYANLDDYLIATLSKYHFAFYKKHGMTTDMSLEELKRFPQLFLHQFYDFLMECKNEEKDEWEKNLLNKLITILNPVAKGSDAHIWNHPSNFPKLSNFTVFDIYELRNLDAKILTSQYYLLMERLWHECVLNRERNKRLPKEEHSYVRITCDELHKILSTRIIATEFKNLSKMIRKYDGGLLTISQATTDYLLPELLEEGKAILSNAIYKFVFSQNTQGLIDSSTVFGLNDKENELLASADQSNCLAIFGKHKTKLINKIPDFILKEIL